MLACDWPVLRVVNNGDSWNLQIHNEITVANILRIVNFGLAVGLLACGFRPGSTEGFGNIFFLCFWFDHFLLSQGSRLLSLRYWCHS